MKMTRRGLLSTGAAVAATHYAGREVAAATESSGFAMANGHKLYYATLGRGMPVIFMHGGLGFDHQYFRPFADPLANAAQVVYYDHLGHGKSDRPANLSEITLERLSTDCDALATALGFDKFVLVGHSYGGFIAFDFAFRFPNRLAGLVFTCTAPDLASGQRDPLGGTPAQADAWARRRQAANATDQEFRANWTVVAPLYYNNASPPAGVLEDVDRRTIYSAAGANRGLEILGGYDFVSRLPNLKVPTAVQYGAGDIWRFGDNERIAKNIPGATLKYYANSGHWPFQEEQSAFIADMREFVTSLTR
jgi:proline-specific peptidase